MVKNFINIIKERKIDFLIQIIASICYSALMLTNPLMFGSILNSVVAGEDMVIIFRKVMIICIIILFQISAGRLIGYCGQVMERNTNHVLKVKAFSKICRARISELDNRNTGDLIQTLSEDVDVIAYNTSHLLHSIFINIITLIGGIFVLFYINIYLAIFTIIPVPIIILLLVKAKKKQEIVRSDLRSNEGLIISKIENLINGIHTTKIFANEEYEIREFKTASNKILKLNKISDLISVKNIFICDFIIEATKCFSYLLAAILIAKKMINVGDFTTYILYVAIFLEPMMINIYIISEIINGKANFDSYNKFMKMKEEVMGIKDNTVNLNSNIAIKDLNFSYSENNEVLRNINIDIKKGQTIALVGSSGSGKSTLCKLLYKFYEYESGSIKIDDVEIKELDTSYLRKNIGIVQQDTYIYNASIRENILYGNPMATFEDIIEASKKAQLHDFIMSLPEQYETQVGEKGIKLSGGEKQRISIARIILRNPKLLILDEATSALDNITEQQIQEEFEKIMKDKTCIVIAHRLSTIKNADKIYVFDSGEIVESGTHEELISKKGTYFKLNNK